MARTKALPKLKARTAYGLLSQVKQLILEEPKRYNQGIFISKRSNGAYNPEEYPACGTIGCVAGWVTMLVDPREDEDMNWYWFEPTKIAQKALGLEGYQCDLLFDGDAVDALAGWKTPAEGTRAYARLGARHITRFQKRYEKQLKAKKIAVRGTYDL